MKIKVSIVDDHPIVIDGLQHIFEKSTQIVLLSSYQSGLRLLDDLEINMPDVLLLDIQMPDISGDVLMLELKKYPNLKTIVLTNYDSALYANNMLKRGAQGYLLKTAGHEQIISAIEKVNAGEIFVDRQMQERIDKMVQQQRNATFSMTTLTPREKEILQLIVEGLTAQEIANKVFLSLGTVKNYRNSIMLKLDADNVASLVRKALKNGLAE